MTTDTMSNVCAVHGWCPISFISRLSTSVSDCWQNNYVAMPNLYDTFEENSSKLTETGHGSLGKSQLYNYCHTYWLHTMLDLSECKIFDTKSVDLHKFNLTFLAEASRWRFLPRNGTHDNFVSKCSSFVAEVSKWKPTSVGTYDFLYQMRFLLYGRIWVKIPPQWYQSAFSSSLKCLNKTAFEANAS